MHYERMPALDGWVIRTRATPEHGPLILGPDSVPDCVAAGIPVRSRYASEAEALGVARRVMAHYASRWEATRHRTFPDWSPYAAGLTVSWHEHAYAVSYARGSAGENTGGGNTF